MRYTDETTFDDAVTAALDLGNAVSVAVSGDRDGKPEYMASVRLPGLAEWAVGFDTDPLRAMVKAVNNAERASVRTLI